MTTNIETRNLDQYGSPALPWTRAQDLLVNASPWVDLPFFLNTVRPDGRPHSVGSVFRAQPVHERRSAGGTGAQ